MIHPETVDMALFNVCRTDKYPTAVFKGWQILRPAVANEKFRHLTEYSAIETQKFGGPLPLCTTQTRELRAQIEGECAKNEVCLVGFEFTTKSNAKRHALLCTSYIKVLLFQNTFLEYTLMTAHRFYGSLPVLGVINKDAFETTSSLQSEFTANAFQSIVKAALMGSAAVKYRYELAAKMAVFRRFMYNSRALSTTHTPDKMNTAVA